jgi:hypothetical protein
VTAVCAEPTTYLTDRTAPRTAPRVAVARPSVADEDERGARLTAAGQRRAAARTRDLSALLRERPDLAGVHAPADFAVEAVRWCA